MKELEAFGDVELTDLLIREFILGRVSNLSEYHEAVVNYVKDKIGEYVGYSFSDWSFQKCKDLFISMKFRGKTLTWKELPQGTVKSKFPALLCTQIAIINLFHAFIFFTIMVRDLHGFIKEVVPLLNSSLLNRLSFKRP